jgi:hypothetical protein
MPSLSPSTEVPLRERVAVAPVEAGLRALDHDKVRSDARRYG